MRILATILVAAFTYTAHADLVDSGYDFGNVWVHTPSPAYRQVFKNPSNQRLRIEGITVEGDSEFYVSSNRCNRALSPMGGWCDFWVHFDPSEPGPRQAVVNVLFTNGEIFRIHVTGTGY